MMSNFRIQCILRVAALGLSMLLFLLLILSTAFYITATLLGFGIVYQVAALIRYVEKTNRDLARFLDAIEYNDFTQSFANVRGGRSFSELRTAFAGVMRKFQHARSEKEAQFLYVQRVVQHVEIGLIAFDTGGVVTLVNDAAVNLAHILAGHGAAVRPEPPAHLRQLPEPLAECLRTLQPDERTLVRFDTGDDTVRLLLHAAHFMLHGRMYTLVSLHNIKSELDRQEIESWQKLARVLTHEIMNSITPIASLASTAGTLFSSYRSEPGTAESITGALQTIEKRSHGLLRFVESYRKLLRVPPPVVQTVRARDLFGRVSDLVRATVQERGIDLAVVCEPAELVVSADPALLEQALLNMVLNAVEAVAGAAHPQIRLLAFRSAADRVALCVQDNGVGMEAEVLDKIFVPFFTTRRDGSGVGLSISRQIVQAHGGTIAVQSTPGAGTMFTIRM